MNKDICIIGAGVAGLVSLLTLIRKLKETNTTEIPKITLFEKRSQADFDKRPQLIVINDIAAERTLQELLGHEEYMRISNGHTMHIGELQCSLWTAIQSEMEANPELKAAITIAFASDAKILDLPTGVVRHRNAEDAWQTTAYGFVVNASGGRSHTKELAQAHNVKYAQYDYQERTPKHAAVMFFLPCITLSADQRIPHQPAIPAEMLAELGWDRAESPNIYIVSKQTESGIVFSVVGEFPNEYDGDKVQVAIWMDYILQITLTTAGVSYKNLKILQASDDASVAKYTNDELAVQVFPMEMEHIESTVYHNEALGDSIGITIGNAASSTNPHLATGAVFAILQGYNVGIKLANPGNRNIGILELSPHFQSLFDLLTLKMRGQQGHYGFKETTASVLKRSQSEGNLKPEIKKPAGPPRRKSTSDRPKLPPEGFAA